MKGLQYSLFPVVQYLTSKGFTAAQIHREFTAVSCDTIRRTKKRFISAPLLEPDFSKGNTVYVFNDLITDTVKTTGRLEDGIIISVNVCKGYDLTNDPLSDSPYTEPGDLIVDKVKTGFLLNYADLEESERHSNTDLFDLLPSLRIGAESAKALFKSTYEGASPHLPRYFAAHLTKPAMTKSVPEPKSKFIATDKSITITSGLKSTVIDFSHPRFAEAMDILRETRDANRVIDLIDLEKEIRSSFVHNNITVENGEVKYKSQVMHSSLTSRIIESLEDRDSKDSLMKYVLFMENLMMNPSNKATRRLFDFLEANDIEITNDGHFIAWKRVGSDFYDLYTGTMLNAPGEILEVDRNTVDEDDTVTCSRGLHVCSKSYLDYYGTSGGNKVVRCKVHPKDVVSIPIDYNNAKMRTCGYKVIDEAKI